jgi:uncharacterized protein YhdP
LNLELVAGSLGTLLGNFGYQGKIKGGKTYLNAALNWRGTPADFVPSKLDGTAKLTVGKGIFYDVDATAGKVLGVLGIHTLRRRLAGNWKDLKGKGLNFDHINGKFVINNGVAHTNETVLKSTVSLVKFDGDINLVRQLFNIRVIVRLKIANSLLAVGAAAGGVAGAAAGGALAIIDKMTRGKVDRAARSKYRIEGSWNNPVVKKIRRGDKANPAHPVDSLTGLPIIE